MHTLDHVEQEQELTVEQAQVEDATNIFLIQISLGASHPYSLTLLSISTLC
jgi:hypothetical protein